MTPVARCQAPAAPGKDTHDGRCGMPLVDNLGRRKPAGTKCCSDNCRGRRLAEQKRLKRERAEATSARMELPEHLRAVADAAAGKVEDVSHEVLVEQVRPIVRDLLTDDVLAGLAKLVGLIPSAIDALQDDINQPDDETADYDRRQRAYTLLLKYTAGNATIAPPPAEQAAAPMQVIFAMPRPGDGPAPSPALSAGEAIELRDCVECEATKPETDFVGSSQRCNTCQAKLEDMIAKRFS